MKRSPQPRRTAELSESVHHQLNMYALAAGAAGVGALALAPPANAKIVYTPAHVIVGFKSNFNLDLNHDGITDFEISNSYTCPIGICGTWALVFGGAVSANRAVGYYSHARGRQLFFSALKRGARIGPVAPFPKQYFGPMVEVISDAGTHTIVLGPWPNTKSRYLGVKFDIKGKTHYGWVRLNVRVQKTAITATLTGYAYETIPNKPIIAGATKGPDVITVQPASLGRLALGRK
jgi:hypothetical protein